MTNLRFLIRGFFVVTLLGACTSGADYKGPPNMALGEISRDLLATSNAGHLLPLDRWWESFNDADLTRLVERAVEKNLDHRIALVRIEAARANLSLADAQKTPTADLSSSVNARRQSVNSPVPVMSSRNQRIYDLGVAASWELDLFGRLKRHAEMARAQTEAAIEEAEGVRLALIAEVVRVYFSLRSAQDELTAKQAGINALTAMLALTKTRVAQGDLPPSETDALLRRFQIAKSSLPALSSRIRSARIALGELTGGLPEQEIALESLSRQARASTPDWPEIPVGQRVEIIERRPDIRVAERQLAAMTAGVGLATAERFPKLVIGASGGFEALRLADLVRETSQALSFMPLFSWRIFDGGRVEAEIRIAEARERDAALKYEKTVLAALADVERSLHDYLRYRESLEAQKIALLHAEKVLAKAIARFAAGDISQIEVNEAQVQESETQETVARATGNVAASLTLAVKSLGGGWRD